MKVSVALLVLLLSSLGMAAERPNVIVIVADDHRYDLMGHKGCAYT